MSSDHTEEPWSNQWSEYADLEKQRRNLRIIDMRKQGHTLQEIANVFSVTRERIRQILERDAPEVGAPSHNWRGSKPEERFAPKPAAPPKISKAMQRRLDPYCINGHEKAAHGTYVSKNGSIICVACTQEAARRCEEKNRSGPEAEQYLQKTIEQHKKASRKHYAKKMLDPEEREKRRLYAKKYYYRILSKAAREANAAQAAQAALEQGEQR